MDASSPRPQKTSTMRRMANSRSRVAQPTSDRFAKLPHTPVPRREGLGRVNSRPAFRADTGRIARQVVAAPHARAGGGAATVEVPEPGGGQTKSDERNPKRQQRGAKRTPADQLR